MFYIEREDISLICMDDGHPILGVTLLMLIGSANRPTFVNDFYWRSQTGLTIGDLTIGGLTIGIV